ncbi:hypothetical protein BJ165DRAFT_190127 [Panaeolus papilionaceus]|nr:hypothetical protein BJ165DRAFT_190127 [Panaeolus papilionaceus]
MSLDHDFVPTLDKNRQRDSITGSSLPIGSGIRSTTSRSPPRPIGRVMSGTDKDSIVERFILPTKVSSITAPSLGTSASTGASALIPPPRPIPPSSSTSPFTPLAQTPPAPVFPISRIRKESFNSTSSSQLSTRDLPPQMSSVSSSPASGGVPIVRRPMINTVHPFKSNTLSSHSGSSPSLSIRQGMLGGSPLSTGGLPSSLSGPGHSRQPSLSSASPNTTRFPTSPIPGAGPAKSSPPPTTFAPSSLGDRRPGTSGSGSSSDRRQSTIAFGSGEPEEPFLPMPPRKRYSSSFSHRYVSATGAPVAGSSGVSPAESSGRDTPAGAGGRLSAGLEGRKDQHGASSYMSNATDDDDISIFVQEIDARKPLSGRTREHEEREKESFNLLGPRNETRRPLGQSHDRETTDTTIKARRLHIDPALSHHRHSSDPPRSSPLSFTRPGIGQTTYDRNPSSSTSPPPPSGISAAAAAASVSPTRGAMLTSRDEVDERLKLMNEKFMNSLKVLDQGVLGTARSRREKTRPPQAFSATEGQLHATTSSQSSSSPSASSVPPSGGSSGSAYPSPYVTTGRGLPAAGEDSSSSAEMSLAPGGQQIQTGLGIAMGDRAFGQEQYDVHMAGRGLGLGRGGHLSTSSTLGHSDGNSQGSEEVLGRMDLYEEKRNSFLFL